MMNSKCLLIATLLCICLPIKANSQSYSYILGDLYDYTPGGINDYDKFLRVTRLNLSTLEQQELSAYQYNRRRYIDINSYNDFYDTGIDLSSGGQSVHDVSANKIRIFGRNPADNINSPETGGKYLEFNLEDNTWSSVQTVGSDFYGTYGLHYPIEAAGYEANILSNNNDISALQSLVKLSGSEVQIGSSSDGVTISSNAVKVGGENLIKKQSDGSVHIGKNSLVLKESGGRQQMWATDANGDSIDIDVTNGSRLLINGRDVEKSIDNVGALSAALGSVPAVSADSQFTCGFGGGTYSSAYAFSAGCASRVSDRVSVNAALATVINNHTGDSDDNLSARAGFTFRLGKIDDSPKVAARKAAELHDKVAKLEERNESLLVLLQAQASRLERLEKIASGQLSLLGDRASSD